MAAETLTMDQKAFLDECNVEFSDRFTDTDLEFKEVYDADIPVPPIMSPWYGRPKMINYRNRGHGGHGSRYGDNRGGRDYNNRRDDNYRDNRRDDNYRDNRRDDNYRDNYRDQEPRDHRDRQHENREDKSFKPY